MYAWKTKPPLYMIATEDPVISPQLEAMMAQTINVTTITVHSSHVIMQPGKPTIWTMSEAPMPGAQIDENPLPKGMREKVETVEVSTFKPKA